MCPKNTPDVVFAPQHIQNLTYREVVTRLSLTISRVDCLLKTLSTFDDYKGNFQQHTRKDLVDYNSENKI